MAAALMAHAEAVAAGWGCNRVALHCNARNDGAVQLYRQMGYRRAALEPVWMPYLQGRAPERCHLWIKRLALKEQSPGAVGSGEVFSQQQ